MRITTIILSALLIQAAPALAHPDHDLEGEVARPPQAVARDHVVRLVSQAKLPASWSQAKVEGTRQRNVRGVGQTIVTFANPAEKNPASRTFHVVVDGEGNVLAAAHILK
jgi:hypothetical protein